MSNSKLYNNQINNKTLVFYHKGCPDGVLSAVLFSRGFERLEFMPIRHYNKVETAGRHVVFLDICFKADYLLEILKNSLSVTIFDHHQTTVDELNILKKMNVNVHLFNKLTEYVDINRSACEIVWDYLYNNFKNINNKPSIVRIITAKDLHKWDTFPYSKELFTGLYNGRWFNFERLNHLLNEGDLHPVYYLINNVPVLNKNSIYYNIYVSGKCIYEYNVKEAQKIIYNGITGTLGEHKILLTTAPYGMISYVSDLVPEYYDIYINAVINPKTNQWNFSLRSKHINVAEIAEKYGGGGHKFASGFISAPDKKIKDYVNIV